MFLNYIQFIHHKLRYKTLILFYFNNRTNYKNLIIIINNLGNNLR